MVESLNKSVEGTPVFKDAAISAAIDANEFLRNTTTYEV
jgi:hypothetical protein